MAAGPLFSTVADAAMDGYSLDVYMIGCCRGSCPRIDQFDDCRPDGDENRLQRKASSGNGWKLMIAGRCEKARTWEEKRSGRVTDGTVSEKDAWTGQRRTFFPPSAHPEWERGGCWTLAGRTRSPGQSEAELS